MHGAANLHPPQLQPDTAPPFTVAARLASVTPCHCNISNRNCLDILLQCPTSPHHGFGAVHAGDAVPLQPTDYTA